MDKSNPTVWTWRMKKLSEWEWGAELYAIAIKYHLLSSAHNEPNTALVVSETFSPPTVMQGMSYCIVTNGETMHLSISIIFQILECNWIYLTLGDVTFLILASLWNCQA